MRDEVTSAIYSKCYDAKDQDACFYEILGKAQESEESLKFSEELLEKLEEWKKFLMQMINQV